MIQISEFVSDKRLASSHKFIYNDEGFIDTPLELDRKYIITNWQTNAFVTGNEAGGFDLDNLYGEELVIGDEYLLIKPAY